MVSDWQLTMDCHDPAVLVPFWAAALDYEAQPPPDGFATWNDWYRSVGVPDDELDPDGDGTDRIRDPAGRKPGIWFQVVPEAKSVKNRLHLDVQVGGGRAVPLELRRQRVLAKVDQLLELGARIADSHADDSSHCAVVMRDPEGNEFCVV